MMTIIAYEKASTKKEKFLMSRNARETSAKKNIKFWRGKRREVRTLFGRGKGASSEDARAHGACERWSTLRLRRRRRRRRLVVIVVAALLVLESKATAA